MHAVRRAVAEYDFFGRRADEASQRLLHPLRDFAEALGGEFVRCLFPRDRFQRFGGSGLGEWSLMRAVEPGAVVERTEVGGEIFNDHD